MARHYTLPNGNNTTSVKEYVTAWDKLGKQMEAFFPGYKLNSYDPAILMIMTHMIDDGTYVTDDYFTITTWAALLLVDTVELKNS